MQEEFEELVASPASSPAAAAVVGWLWVEVGLMLLFPSSEDRVEDAV